jgi:hypothetical protein
MRLRCLGAFRNSFVRILFTRSEPLVTRIARVSVCLALMMLVIGGRQVASSPPAATAVAVIGPADGDTRSGRSDQQAFRLGNAAEPFGRSTVVSDFNTDGRPDVAVADHVARRTSNYAYRIEFSLSGQAPRDVTFESSRAAITIAVVDIDRDNDLDLIVGTPLSGETVGIWLNDGQGHFTAGDLRQAPPTIRSLQSVDTDGPLAYFVAFEPSPRHTDAGMPAMCSTSLGHAGHRFVNRHLCIARRLSPSSQSAPRAPPPLLLSVSS